MKSHVSKLIREMDQRNRLLKRIAGGDVPGLARVWQKDLLLMDSTMQGALLATPAPPQGEVAPFSATFVVSTSAQDRDGDVIRSLGCRVENYRKAGAPWFFNHQQYPLPIGTSINPQTGKLDVWPGPSQVVAQVWFDDAPFAQEIARLVRKGLLRGVSVGLQPLRIQRLDKSEMTDKERGGLRNTLMDGYLISEWDLLEISVCGVGANPEALRHELRRNYSPQVRKALLGDMTRRVYSLPAGGKSRT